jgi:hypothetical protein
MRCDFALRYGHGGAFLGLLGLGRRFSRVTLDDTHLRLGMGWAFAASIPRDQILRATVDPRSHWWAVGVHATARNTWLVNGSTRGVVWLDLVPFARAHTMGFPLKLRRLGVSLEDPEAFAAAVNRDETS